MTHGRGNLSVWCWPSKGSCHPRFPMVLRSVLGTGRRRFHKGSTTVRKRQGVERDGTAFVLNASSVLMRRWDNACGACKVYRIISGCMRKVSVLTCRLQARAPQSRVLRGRSAGRHVLSGSEVSLRSQSASVCGGCGELRR